MKRNLNLYEKSQILFLLLFALLLTNSTTAQSQQNDPELLRAMGFVAEGRHLDALPILEKVAPRYPKDASIQAHFGVAILANSVILKDENARRREVARAAEILREARKLGTDNVVALHYLDLIESGKEVGVAFNAASKEVEEAIREGENYFGRGEYDKAFAAYERAYKLDPKSYEAALFAGDTFYAQKKFKESEPWFAKAAALDPDREQAFRFWGDALANQGKTKEALVKFAEAFIAEPNSRLTADSFFGAVKNYGDRRSSPLVSIPAKENESEIVIDQSRLKESDGTLAWNRFAEIRKAQIEKFNTVANGRAFASTISEDVAALKEVALAAKDFSRSNNPSLLDKSLQNLIKLESLGMLDVYTILFIHGGDNSSEYEKFRVQNRERMRRFLVDYFAEDKL